jgi:putative endonuclease
MKKYTVYILKCSNKSYYTGVTSDLINRFNEHQLGKHKNSYTYSKRPVELVYFCEFTNIEQAISMEKKLKKWSRIKKEALINNEFEKLPNLCKKSFE